MSQAFFNSSFLNQKSTAISICNTLELLNYEEYLDISSVCKDLKKGVLTSAAIIVEDNWGATVTLNFSKGGYHYLTFTSDSVFKGCSQHIALAAWKTVFPKSAQVSKFKITGESVTWSVKND